MTFFSEKVLFFPIDALVVWCPTWSKNLGRTLIGVCWTEKGLNYDNYVVHNPNSKDGVFVGILFNLIVRFDEEMCQNHCMVFSLNMPELFFIKIIFWSEYRGRKSTVSLKVISLNHQKHLTGKMKALEFSPRFIGVYMYKEIFFGNISDRFLFNKHQ